MLCIVLYVCTRINTNPVKTGEGEIPSSHLVSWYRAFEMPMSSLQLFFCSLSAFLSGLKTLLV